jgi:hypothetical protein
MINLAWLSIIADKSEIWYIIWTFCSFFVEWQYSLSWTDFDKEIYIFLSLNIEERYFIQTRYEWTKRINVLIKEIDFSEFCFFETII